MKPSKPQQGSVLPLTLFLLVALMSMAALAVDLGLMYHARQQAQDIADASALAGGRLLPNAQSASSVASQMVAANNGSASAWTATNPTTVTQDDGTTVTAKPGHALLVQGYVNAPLSFAPLIGYAPTSRDGAANTVSVSARAGVLVQTVCGLPSGAPVAPFGLIGDDPNSTDPAVVFLNKVLSGGQTLLPGVYQPVSSRVTLKINVWDSAGTLKMAGSFDPLQISAATGRSYASAISSMDDQALATGQSLSTQTGNQIVQTEQGVAARLSASNGQFTHRYAVNPANQSHSIYAEWFFGDHTQPVDSSQPPVNDNGTTLYYHQDPHRQELSEAHLLVLPIVSQGAKGKPGSATLLAWASFFVEQVYSDGSNQIVQGRFIGLTLSTGSGGACTEAGDLTPPRLVQ